MEEDVEPLVTKTEEIMTEFLTGIRALIVERVWTESLQE